MRHYTVIANIKVFFSIIILFINSPCGVLCNKLYFGASPWLLILFQEEVKIICTADYCNKKTSQVENMNSIFFEKVNTVGWSCFQSTHELFTVSNVTKQWIHEKKLFLSTNKKIVGSTKMEN